MVNLGLREIQLGDKTYPITSFEVWWFLPGLGLYRNMDDAVNLKGGNVVIPTPVAVSDRPSYNAGPNVLMYEVVPSEVS